jgi:2-amino-4-hydroxy-6-hydroxymethyldihydropteridine diphosphokinase
VNPSTAVRAYIGLGANLGDACATVNAAIAALDTLPETRLVARSACYRSAPVGYLDQPDFVNAVAAIDTQLAPEVLLDALLALEAACGRVRSFANAPRTLDLDLLLYGDATLATPRLTVPHPRMAGRGFVLVPLAEIAPSLHFPDGTTLASLLPGLQTEDLVRLS